MNHKITCPICDSYDLDVFLIRKNVPVHQNLLYSEQNSAVKALRGNLTLTVCDDCGFIFNQTFDPSKLSYGENYDNTQDISPYFKNHLTQLVNRLIFEKKVRNCTIVEIGCGKGSFLRKLIENKEYDNIGYGFDPSYLGPESDLEGRLKFVKKFYDTDCADVAANMIISRHVIEHIPDPLNLLKLVRKAMSNSKHGQVFFETPSVDWILQNQVIYDFFYEHCSYFSPSSLRTAFEKSGFKVQNINTIFKDQYLWLEAYSASEKIEITKNPDFTTNSAKKFSSVENSLKKNWEKKIHDLTERGKVAIWGAGAKGVTFSNLIDPQRKLIDCVIDLNYKKQGKFIAGTGHPIINFKEISTRKIKSAVLMNPNYYEETIDLLRKNDTNLNLVL